MFTLKLKKDGMQVTSTTGFINQLLQEEGDYELSLEYTTSQAKSLRVMDGAYALQITMSVAG
jgi:hypothetical protein